MRPTQVSLAANGASTWIRTDLEQTPFSASVAVICSGTVSLTYSAQYTLDDFTTTWYRGTPYGLGPIGVTQTTTVITVTNDFGPPGNGGTHGLSVGDEVTVIGSSVTRGTAGIDGQYPVASIVSATSYTLTSPNSLSYTAGPGVQVASARVFTVTGLNAIVGGTTARTYVALPAAPITGIRLLVASYATGVATLVYNQGMSK